jgi:GNAT superfamily N-acetyltransferase
MSVNALFPVQEYRRTSYLISTDGSLLNLDIVHDFLANHSYWAQDVSRETVARSLEHALCFGVYHCQAEPPVQVGLARLITDFATFAYISDVFIVPDHRGQGLGKWLMTCLLQHPALQTLRRWTLDTRDAHGLYRQFGFEIKAKPANHMEFRPSRPEQEHSA